MLVFIHSIYYVHGHSVSQGIIRFSDFHSGVAGGSVAPPSRVKISKKNLNRSTPEDEATTLNRNVRDRLSSDKVLYLRRMLSVNVIKHVNCTDNRDGEKGMKAHSKFWKFHCQNFMTFFTLLLYLLYIWVHPKILL